ncbi:YsnF/AvaK domain-containing protein [Bacillus sp. FJAT-44742]|uniref:YsnF/AvaK domain-containing protein n=1 Tax=Bacillus sp. FJAT-44742 TaxID=2014005 RepID=UPI000C24AB5E|nr:YsnF/AvaK domain-containing protein [Bacillus sp. FJAT-44742]
MKKSILFGSIIGGLIIFLLGGSFFAGVVMGGIIGGIWGAFFRQKKSLPRKSTKKGSSLKVREEELEIKKVKVPIGEVNVHKEVIKDKKTITVPIKREEMVIEAGDEEYYRIPLKEEEIKVSKHPVTLNDVSIKKQRKNEIQKVKTTLKKEKVISDVNGEADMKEQDPIT